MEEAIKIKSENWVPQIGIPIIVLTIIFAIIDLIFGERSFQSLIACLMTIMAVFHLVLTGSTRNLNYLIPLTFYSFTALTFFSTVYFSALTVVFAVLAGISFVGFLYVLTTRKIKWRYREVLELAARSVFEAADGFTNRPFPAGEANYTRQEIIDFARYLLKHAIAYPVFESNGVVLVIPANLLLYLFGFKRNYSDASFVTFSFDGRVSVKIAKKDYQEYTDELTFDQLCNSFGILFKHFLNQFQTGKSQQIIEQMNQLKFIV